MCGCIAVIAHDKQGLIILYWLRRDIVAWLELYWHEISVKFELRWKSVSETQGFDRFLADRFWFMAKRYMDNHIYISSRQVWIPHCQRTSKLLKTPLSYCGRGRQNCVTYIYQHWFRQWFVVVWNQAFTWPILFYRPYNRQKNACRCICTAKLWIPTIQMNDFLNECRFPQQPTIKWVWKYV